MPRDRRPPRGWLDSSWSLFLSRRHSNTTAPRKLDTTRRPGVYAHSQLLSPGCARKQGVRMIRRISSCLILGLFVATNAAAQLASQTALVGTVTDSGGLVVPGAQVVAVNVGTKDTYEATTNAEGYYTIQFVRTGTYEITVTMSGFQTFKASGVEVTNNQVVRTNAVLKVGGLTELVTVEAKS